MVSVGNAWRGICLGGGSSEWSWSWQLLAELANEKYKIKQSNFARRTINLRMSPPRISEFLLSLIILCRVPGARSDQGLKLLDPTMNRRFLSHGAQGNPFPYRTSPFMGVVCWVRLSHPPLKLSLCSRYSEFSLRQVLRWDPFVIGDVLRVPQLAVFNHGVGRASACACFPSVCSGLPLLVFEKPPLANSSVSRRVT